MPARCGRGTGLPKFRKGVRTRKRKCGVTGARRIERSLWFAFQIWHVWSVSFPLKRIGLARIRDLFQTCSTQEQSQTWIQQLEDETVKKSPYKDILETIWDLQDKQPDEAVEYAGVRVALRTRSKPVDIPRDELVKICEALSRIAPQMISARQQYVELSQRPDKVLDALGSAIKVYPEEEQPKNGL